ncbi:MULTISPECIES: triose-phosphate isomerase [unclassified Sedimentibacter]|uniref:triose-phosphate isomerase n=1 Tax=unclassified Sedimentibacter TaxID=2649220 RepID=UPI0027DFF246|nr:triose-phosphate isomerase [Sedimentibacter sp. MB35-C1]WMJ76370.1 triose-phosphate isomerase [Sedimentibacter sp. MB35-C1]
MRKTLIAGNWKMNNDIEQSLMLAENLKSLSGEFDNNVDVLICPTFTSLYSVKEVLKNSNIKIGAQNMHFEDKGAYTGEISPLMLKEMGIEYVIIGHSERRQYFNETDETVNKKLKSALEYGIIPILCVGETLEQRDSGIEKETVRNQITKAFNNIEASDAEKITVAYEPIWAIGTGRTASSKQANDMASFIRKCISEIYSKESADNVIIQYGGSVKGSNAKEILSESDIDGALVGGASLKADEFLKIINYAK